MTTKTRMIPTIVVIAVVGILAGVGGGWDMITAPMRHADEEHIELTVRFTPSPNHLGIHIIAHVDGREVVNHLADQSPWGPYPMWVRKGAEVSLSAQQSTPDMVMCTITSNTHLISTNVKKGELGSARCWHNRRPTIPQP